jgi:hypothetical protein
MPLNLGMAMDMDMGVDMSIMTTITMTIMMITMDLTMGMMDMVNIRLIQAIQAISRMLNHTSNHMFSLVYRGL